MGPNRGIWVGVLVVVVLVLPCLFFAPTQAAAQTTSANCVQSGTNVFHNNAFSTQESQFNVSFAATPNQAGMYGLVGFSLNAATTDDSLAAIVRFAYNGMIDVRNGTNFSANVAFPYKAEVQYQFQLVINPATKRYSVFVTAPGGSRVELASNYAFRSTLSNLSSLNNWAAYTQSGTESVCNMTIGTITTTVPVAPAITTQPFSRTITAGQTATFSVVATGTAPLSYQWRQNGVAISGATASSYTTPAETTSASGAQFTVVVSNSAGTITSNAATLTVNAAAVAPSITTQPASQTITAGQTATFSVVAAGTAPLSYQWKQNGVAISGATASSYTTPAETTSANGAQFTVVVSNSAGTITSNAATLTVNAAAVAPSITTQPASQTITAGQTATFSATATGTAPLSYQWRQNGTAISGATALSYTTPAETTSANGAQFTVVVTNSAGSVSSNAATLTVNAAAPGALTPSTTSLSFNNVNVGSNGSLSVTFTNSGSSNITVSNVSMSGAGFTAGGVSNGQIITPGQVVTMTVTFAPAATGSVTGSVTVASNASNSPVSISLSGTGQIGSTNTSGWTYIQDSITTGGGTCLAGSSSCTIGVSLMFPTTAGSVWLVRTHTGNNVQIASVTGGGGTWTHCPSCAVFNSTLNQSIDASYNLSGGAGTTAVTVTLAAPASGFFQVNFIELLPPSGSTASFDAAAATSSNSCSTCTGAGLSLSGTDAVFQTQAGNGVSGWNGWSSPYITDGRGNGIGLNVTSGAAPTVKMNSSIGGLFMAIAFKSSAGSFTPPAQQFSAVNFTSPAAGANCTPSCTLTIPFTGSGHLLYLEVGDINNAHIVSISGGGTWVIPGGSNSCAIVLSPNQALSCGYILSSTAGATSLNLTMSGSGAIAYAVWEIATTSGSFALDTQGSTQNPATGFNPRGQALTLTGTNDVIFQSIFAPGGTSSVTLYPMGYINGQGQLFFNNQAGLAALLNTTNGAAPEWATENVPTTVFGVAFKATAATPAAPATLNSSSSTLAFGNITVGTSANLSATLTNSGNSSVTLSAVSISGPGFNASGISVGQIIPAGQTATLDVTFAPAATASVTGSVTITSNASNSPTIISFTGTGAAAVSHSATLTWMASTSVVIGYNVYRSTVSAGPFNKLTPSGVSAITYSDSTVQAGQTYYYVVTAVNLNNIESVYSNEVSATLP